MIIRNILRAIESRNFQLAFFVPLLYSLIASIDTILNAWTTIDMQLDAKQAKHDRTHDTKFDFIIVGAGSAGCLVANRLSRHFNVLLLEAGGEPNPLQFIPSFGAFLINRPAVDWMYRAVPQRRATLNNINQQPSINGGKGIGGSGNLNDMVFLRGSPKDFDNWGKITKDASWSYESILPFFKRYEKYADPNGDPKYRGFSGDIGIEVPDYQGIAEEFLATAREIGIPTIDPNSPHNLGAFKIQQTSSGGVRDAPYLSLIRPIRNRKTLTIRKFAIVNKIIFHENGRSVSGVEYDRHGKTHRVYAKKEVIISAGAIATPKLLMLSGIGPKEHIEELGIKCRLNLPVGKNLQEHLGVFFGPIFINQSKSMVLSRDLTPGAILNWLTSGRGVLGSSGIHAGAVLSSSYAKARGESNWGDIQLSVAGLSTFEGFSDAFATLFNKKPDELREYYEDAIGKESLHILVAAARPIARGQIRLGGSSPYDQLLIDPNFLNDIDDIDLNVLVEGLEKTVYLFENTTAGRSLGARFTNTFLPGCTHLRPRSREYFKCYVRRYSYANGHVCCTAAMGYIGSPSAVVDPELKVQGLQNLRVIDASVIPVIQSANPQAGVLMIAEKGAQLVLDRWNNVA